MSVKNTRNKTLRHFDLKPLECFNHLQLSTNREVLQRFFWIQDHGNKLQPKKEIALKIYHELSEKYAMIPCPMKGKQVSINGILKLDSEYYRVAKNVKNYKHDEPNFII